MNRYTEEVARTKWCPMVRAVPLIYKVKGEFPDWKQSAPQVLASCNRVMEVTIQSKMGKQIDSVRYSGDSGAQPYACCIGSDCMAWTWGDWPDYTFIKAPNPRAEHEFEAGERPAGCEGWKFLSDEENDGDGAVWIEPLEEVHKRRLGFCGMVKR